MGSCPRCRCPVEPPAACACARAPCAAALALWPQGPQPPRHSAEHHSLQPQINPCLAALPPKFIFEAFLLADTCTHLYQKGVVRRCPAIHIFHSAMIFAESNFLSSIHRCHRGTPRQGLMLQETLGAPPACLERAPPAQHIPHTERCSTAELPSPGPLLQYSLGYAVHCMFPTIGTINKERFTTTGAM